VEKELIPLQYHSKPISPNKRKKEWCFVKKNKNICGKITSKSSESDTITIEHWILQNLNEPNIQHSSIVKYPSCTLNNVILSTESCLIDMTRQSLLKLQLTTTPYSTQDNKRRQILLLLEI
jgi:hypothetical protein